MTAKLDLLAAAPALMQDYQRFRPSSFTPARAGEIPTATTFLGGGSATCGRGNDRVFRACASILTPSMRSGEVQGKTGDQGEHRTIQGGLTAAKMAECRTMPHRVLSVLSHCFQRHFVSA